MNNEYYNPTNYEYNPEQYQPSQSEEPERREPDFGEPKKPKKQKNHTGRKWVLCISMAIVSLAGSVCGIVAQYQEYHAHGELISQKDPKLADKWNSLFWLELAVIVITTLLSSVLLSALVMAAGMEETAVTALVVAIVAAVTLLMKLLYLRYLNRTTKLLETEVVEE